VDPDLEGQGPGIVARPPAQHGGGLAAVLDEGVEERRLADPRLARHRREPAPSRRRPPHRLGQTSPHLLTTDERRLSLPRPRPKWYQLPRRGACAILRVSP